MKPTTSNILSIAGLAASAVSAAETTTTASSSSSTCAAQSILDACLDTTTGYVVLCETTDYQCLCDKYTAIMTCFDNCPNDSRESSYDSERQLYCANASAFATTTTTAKTASQTDASTTGSAEPADATSSSHAASATKTAAAASPTGAADTVAVGGKGLLSALVGVVAAALL